MNESYAELRNLFKKVFLKFDIQFIFVVLVELLVAVKSLFLSLNINISNFNLTF